MGFLSAGYFAFFPAVALVYFLLPGRARNGFLLLASWFFYLCAGVESFPFLALTTLLTYGLALRLEKHPSRALLCLAVVGFVAVLGVFKYLDFGASLLRQALALVGLDWSPVLPKLLLPAGISFYFFAAMGYLIDIYRGKAAAERNFVKCALFLSFFPYLLSGPIGRAGELLPQFNGLHNYDDEAMREGLLRFLWGAFKKLLLADKLAVVVDTVFAAPANFGRLQVIGAAVAFSLQIYCDFSAYSDMAVGSARAMGFTLTENFRTPYFARSIAEFWRRWHMTLGSWFREYLYIPLGGSRRGVVRKYLNVLIVFTVSGLWHGSAVTFLVWGLLNGLYQVVGALAAPARDRVRAVLPLREDGLLLRLWQMGWVFGLSTLAWVFFECPTIPAALAVLRNMVKPVLWDVGGLPAMGLVPQEFPVLALALALLVAVDALSQKGDVAQGVLKAPWWQRWLVYLALLLAVVIFGSYGTGYDAQSFIYGQF